MNDILSALFMANIYYQNSLQQPLKMPLCILYLQGFTVDNGANGPSTKPWGETLKQTCFSINLDNVFGWKTQNEVWERNTFLRILQIKRVSYKQRLCKQNVKQLVTWYYHMQKAREVGTLVDQTYSVLGWEGEVHVRPLQRYNHIIALYCILLR